MTDQLKNPLLDQVPILINPEQFKDEVTVTSLSDETPIVYLNGLLTAKECEHLIEMGRPKLANSTMIVNNKEIVNQNRSSRTGPISYHGDPNPKDPVLNKLLNKLSRYCGYPMTHIEAVKVVNYQDGQKYVPHHDYFTDAHPHFLVKAGDRCITFFIYLNTVDEKNGGATHFPQLKLDVQPKQGDAVFWLNMTSDGKYRKKTQHGGSLVTGEGIEKWGLNVWFREKSFR